MHYGMELDDCSFFCQSFLSDLSISIGPIQWFCRLTRRTADKFPLLQPRSHGWVLPIDLISNSSSSAFYFRLYIPIHIPLPWDSSSSAYCVRVCTPPAMRFSDGMSAPMSSPFGPIECRHALLCSCAAEGQRSASPIGFPAVSIRRQVFMTSTNTNASRSPRERSFACLRGFRLVKMYSLALQMIPRHALKDSRGNWTYQHILVAAVSSKQGQCVGSRRFHPWNRPIHATTVNALV